MVARKYMLLSGAELCIFRPNLLNQQQFFVSTTNSKKGKHMKVASVLLSALIAIPSVGFAQQVAPSGKIIVAAAAGEAGGAGGAGGANGSAAGAATGGLTTGMIAAGFAALAVAAAISSSSSTSTSATTTGTTGTTGTR